MDYVAFTHIVYVLLVIAFLGAISYMVIYNLRMKARLKDLQAGGRRLGTAEGIVAAQESLRREPRKR